MLYASIIMFETSMHIGPYMITSRQMRAARALLDIDQRQLADLSDLSLPTIQRMEASEDIVRGNVDSLMKLIAAIDRAGLELIGEDALSPGGGRGVRLKASPRKQAVGRHRGAATSRGRAD
jgi:transcriptional regulator with XRE-family HTH domain